MIVPNIDMLLEEMTMFLLDETKSGNYQVNKEDIQVMLAYIHYLRQVESHVKNSISNDILSPYGFRQHG
jgi:hypothetical protein